MLTWTGLESRGSGERDIRSDWLVSHSVCSKGKYAFYSSEKLVTTLTVFLRTVIILACRAAVREDIKLGGFYKRNELCHSPRGLAPLDTCEEVSLGPLSWHLWACWQSLIFLPLVAFPHLCFHLHRVFSLCAYLCSNFLFLSGHHSHWVRDPPHSPLEPYLN